MSTAVLGARVHSGWAAVVAVSGYSHAVQVVDRRRIVITDAALAGAKQPYHFAEDMKLPDAEKHLAKCAAISDRVASGAIREMVNELQLLGYQVPGAAIIMAAGRPLPDLAGILASHALIHTAEGEFYRGVLRRACEGQKIAVTGIRERDLEQQASETFGRAALGIEQKIAGLGRLLGPPWTQDHKTAALAASIILANLVDRRTAKGPAASVD